MEIRKIAKLIEERGGRLYLVGGAIRDRLLNKEVSDEDYSVTGLTGKEFEELFGAAITRRKIL